MSAAVQRALQVAEGQQWLSPAGNLVVVVSADDDQVEYERVEGAGRARGRISAYHLIKSYRLFERELDREPAAG